MTIRLDLVPERKTLPSAMNLKRKFISLFMVFASSVFLLTVLNQYIKLPLYGKLVICIIPVLVFSIIYAFQFFTHRANVDLVKDWNKKRDKNLQAKITRGQRSATVIHFDTFSAKDNYELSASDVLEASDSLMAVQLPRNPGNKRLGELKHTHIMGEDQDHAEDIVMQFLKSEFYFIKSKLPVISSAQQLHIIIDIAIKNPHQPNKLNFEWLCDLIKTEFPALNHAQFVDGSILFKHYEESELMNHWLDCRFEVSPTTHLFITPDSANTNYTTKKQCLWVLSGNLSDAPTEGNGEGLASLIMCNYLGHSATARTLYRPETAKFVEFHQHLNYSVLWSQTQIAAYRHAWLSGGKLTDFSGFLATDAYENLLNNDGKLASIESLLGNLERSSLWMALGLSLQCMEASDIYASQWVVHKRDNISSIWSLS